MIKSFSDKQTEKLWNQQHTRFPSGILNRAYAKLRILSASESLEDLCTPPSNHLEALAGNRAGQYSIRINRQWRICFFWNDGNAEQVEITDYH